MKALSSPASDRKGQARSRRWISFAALLVAWASVSSASADTPSAGELEAARSAFAEGLTLEGNARWRDALERFERAAAVRSSPQVSFHRGLCLERLGRLVAALDAFVRAEHDAVGDANARRVGALASRHGASLRKRMPTVVLHAPSSDAAIAVLLDGEPLRSNVFEMALPVDPGVHRFVFRVAGREPSEEEVTTREGERREVTVRLGPPSVLAPEATPAPEPMPAPVAAVRPQPEPAARATSRGWLATPLVLAGVAASAFVTAGVLYGLRGAALGELEAGCAGQPTCPDGLRPVSDAGKAYTSAGNVALGIGLVAAVGASVTFFVLRPHTGPVGVAARGSTLVLEGKF
jgi:hypothetical protein